MGFDHTGLPDTAGDLLRMVLACRRAIFCEPSGRWSVTSVVWRMKNCTRNEQSGALSVAYKGNSAQSDVPSVSFVTFDKSVFGGTERQCHAQNGARQHCVAKWQHLSCALARATKYLCEPVCSRPGHSFIILHRCTACSHQLGGFLHPGQISSDHEQLQVHGN